MVNSRYDHTCEVCGSAHVPEPCCFGCRCGATRAPTMDDVIEAVACMRSRVGCGQAQPHQAMARLSLEMTDVILAHLAAVVMDRDKARANYQWMVEHAADEKLDGCRELGATAARAEQEREDARRFARSLVEKVRRIQSHIEAGGANEELTAATVLCSEILAEDEWGTV